ncbi:MAG: DUF3368 domain-containing protein [Blastochloris sp.]|nr:DUF3368 domain-containing protein [Blastochloris sp.]
MIVVSDTSVITSLLQIGQIGLLPQLYARVVLPEAVYEELGRAHSDLPSFLIVQKVQNRSDVVALEKLLDKGESEAIILSLEIHAQALLMDEAKGREVARSKGLRVVGLLGVLVQARRSGKIGLLAPVLTRLRNEVGFYISKELESTVLRTAGE